MAFRVACSDLLKLVLNCSELFYSVRYKAQKKHQNLSILMLAMVFPTVLISR